MVSGHRCSVLPQIGRWWVQGRLVVGMGHTSECGVVVASVGAPPWPMLSGGSQAMGRGWEVGGKWAHVVRTPPDRKVVGAGPVGSGHGSYQLVSWWGGQCWCPPMAHAQWWQPGERDPRRRDVGAAWHEESVWLRNGLLIMPCCADVATSRIALPDCHH